MEAELGLAAEWMKKFRVLMTGWLMSIAVSVVGMLLAALIFSVAGEGQNRIAVSVYILVILAILTGSIYVGHCMARKKFLWGMLLGAFYGLTLCLIAVLSGCVDGVGWQVPLPFVLLCLGSGMLGGMIG